jgi:ubiquitin carboxyl-terminal hydrolase 25/28
LTKLKNEGLCDPSPETLITLDADPAYIDTELRMLRDRVAALKAELEATWADAHDAAYELTSVFIHRGASPAWGHYFFYSRDLPGNPDRWFKYNDSEVTEVPKEEVFRDTTGETANPYLVSIWVSTCSSTIALLTCFVLLARLRSHRLRSC